ncbi:MAG: PaaI family thioesterase [Oscillospiraceae bacterium]|nr:PaaI family thioesterase [Oscillospiraceae bacterium]
MKIDLERIREQFSKDLFATNSGIVIDSVTEDRVVCSMELTPNHKNSVGGVQGGAIFTLADLAFAVHCNMDMVCGEDVGVTVGQSCSISFLKATRGSRLIAETSCLSKGRRVLVYRVSVKDDLGTDIAEMLANGFRTAKINT